MAKAKKKKTNTNPNKRGVAKVTFVGGPKNGTHGEYDERSLNKGKLMVNMARDRYDFETELPPTKHVPHWRYIHNSEA